MRTPMAVRLANAVKSLSSSRRRKSASTHNRVAARVDVLENRQLLAGVFTQLTNPIPNGASGTMMLLTDGTVMVRGVETPRLQPFGNLNLNGIGLSNEWHKLTPDNLGNYLNGTWSPMASMNNERLGAGSVATVTVQDSSIVGSADDGVYLGTLNGAVANLTLDLNHFYQNSHTPHRRFLYENWLLEPPW